MSFSSTVKKELALQYGDGRHCGIAEISAIICCAGRITAEGLLIRTENIYATKKLYRIIKKEFGIKCHVEIKRSNQLYKHNNFIITINESDAFSRIIKSTGIFINKNNEIEKKIPVLQTNSTCCKRAYIRGLFLCCGSITEPDKNNHLEFAVANESFGLDASNLLNNLDLDLAPKITYRKGRCIIYFKDGEQICRILSATGAFKAMMYYENTRILKDVNNIINRRVNCQNANMDKTMSAALKQISDIMLIEKKQGLSSLPINLEEIARKRLDNPEISLSELGLLLSPPVGKSGVYHRLKKIGNIADSLK